MMKLSFSKSSSSSSSKPNQNAFNSSADGSMAAEKQFVTNFDPSKTLASNQRSHRLGIPPPKANEWRPLKKMKNLDLPLGSTNDEGIALQFEVATDTIGNGEASNMSYGLNLRQLKDEVAGSVGESKPSSIESLMRQKLKEDLNNLTNSVNYDERPVEGYGAALLARYGWVEGRGIGKNAKEDVKIVEYKGCTGRKGLGFEAAEKRYKEKTRIDDKKQSSRIRREGKERRSSREGEERRSYPPKKKSSSSSPAPPSWLTSHIRVRVVSKKLKGGRLYLKKGKVLDVVGPTTCDISMDETGEIIQGVGQVVLETALPRRGGPVLVLFGKHKGVYGSLIEKYSEDERGVVRDADSHALLNVKLEQIAEFTEDPECLGY